MILLFLILRGQDGPFRQMKWMETLYVDLPKMPIRCSVHLLLTSLFSPTVTGCVWNPQTGSGAGMSCLLVTVLMCLNSLPTRPFIMNSSQNHNEFGV